jgi:hypothetical protein
VVACAVGTVQERFTYENKEAQSAREAICEELEKLGNVDLVVMGTRGLGVVSRYIVATCERVVVVVCYVCAVLCVMCVWRLMTANSRVQAGSRFGVRVRGPERPLPGYDRQIVAFI